jgi:DNA-binding LacI/PurR family transcriptional regulator
MVTLRDVAHAAGVSPATASRALSHPGIVTPVRRARVERAAAELGYRRVDVIPPPRRVGLIVPDLHNPYFSGIAKGIQHRVRIAGLSLLIADSDEDPHLEVELIHEMAPQVDAIVLCSPRMPDHMLTGLDIEPPIVLVNREAAGVPSVVVDNASGIRQAVRHLHALGHRRIAYVGGKRGSWSERERSDGIAASSAELGIDAIHLGSFPTTFPGGVAAADLVAASDASAVVAHNDLMAVGILDRLRQRGTVVPDELSVVGFDDVPAATYVSPALTTIQVALDLLGRIAVDLLISPDSVPDAVHGTCRMPVSLVVRDSTGPAPARPLHADVASSSAAASVTGASPPELRAL